MSNLVRAVAGVVGASSVDATVNYVESLVSGADSSSYTFTLTVGNLTSTGLTKRYIAVGVDTGNTESEPTGVTIMGTASTTKIVGVVGSGKVSSIWLTDAPVTSNGTLTVIVALSSTNRAAIGVWELFNINPTATATATSTASTLVLSHNTLAGGVSVATGNRLNNTTMTWVGLTENYDENGGDAGGGHTGASLAHSSATTPLTITSGTSGTSGCSAHFQKE